jgi:hypothetical protein
MHKLHELKEKLIGELEGYAENGKFSKEDVEVIKYMSSAVDHLCNIIDNDDGEYSGDNSYRYGDRSYARGRGRNARRDSMGRYSREGDFADQLRMLMDDAPDAATRQKLKRMVDELA